MYTCNKTLKGIPLFGYRYTLKMASEKSRLPSLMWVDLNQLIEGLNKKKRLTPLQVGVNFLLHHCLELGHHSFFAFRHELKHLQFLGLKPTGFGLELHHQLSSSLPYLLQISGLVRLHNYTLIPYTKSISGN